MSPIAYIITFAIGFVYGMNAESYSTLVSTIIIVSIFSVVYNYLVKKKRIYDFTGNLERK